jgi:hypothetical protein
MVRGWPAICSHPPAAGRSNHSKAAPHAQTTTSRVTGGCVCWLAGWLACRKFKPWVWAVTPFFPAHRSWHAARAAAELPLNRSERLTLTYICACAVASLVLWASQFRLLRLRQPATRGQAAPHGPFLRWMLASGFAGAAATSTVTIFTVPQETNASVVCYALLCFDMVGCSAAMRLGPSKLAADHAAFEGALLAVWLHATLWTPYKVVLLGDSIGWIVLRRPELLSRRLPSIWLLDMPAMTVAWAAWLVVSAALWHRCWRWRRRRRWSWQQGQ